MVAAAIFVVPAALAWACVGIISLNVASSRVDPGGTVTVTGREFAEGAPVEIRLDSATGPVLATAPPPTTTMTSSFRLDVRIPPDVKPGPHVLVATQHYHNMNAGAPARAMIHVGTAPPVALAGEATGARAPGLIARSGPSAVSLLLIGLGAAAASLMLAAFWNLAASRPRAATHTVETS